MNYQEIMKKHNELMSLDSYETLTDLYQSEIKTIINNKDVLMDLITEKEIYLVFIYYKEKFKSYPNLENHLESLIETDFVRTLMRSINWLVSIEEELRHLEIFKPDTIQFYINEVNK
jgi:hypothetical protein